MATVRWTRRRPERCAHENAWWQSLTDAGWLAARRGRIVVHVARSARSTLVVETARSLIAHLRRTADATIDVIDPGGSATAWPGSADRPRRHRAPAHRRRVSSQRRDGADALARRLPSRHGDGRRTGRALRPRRHPRRASGPACPRPSATISTPRTRRIASSPPTSTSHAERAGTARPIRNRGGPPATTMLVSNAPWRLQPESQPATLPALRHLARHELMTAPNEISAERPRARTVRRAGRDRARRAHAHPSRTARPA